MLYADSIRILMTTAPRNTHQSSLTATSSPNCIAIERFRLKHLSFLSFILQLHSRHLTQCQMSQSCQTSSLPPTLTLSSKPLTRSQPGVQPTPVFFFAAQCRCSSVCTPNRPRSQPSVWQNASRLGRIPISQHRILTK
jgi:hypothetical protein